MKKSLFFLIIALPTLCVRAQPTLAASYSVLGSTNLKDWAVIGVSTETTPGIFEFTDTEAPAHDCRFYKLRSP